MNTQKRTINATQKATIFLLLAVICTILGIRSLPSLAAELTPGSSFGAVLSITPRPTPVSPESQNKTVVSEGAVVVAQEDIRVTKIKTLLAQYRSPMIGLEEFIVTTADQYGTDPFLVVAISGQESTFGTYRCGYNAWGYASCAVRFSSWEDGITRVSKLLSGAPYNAINGGSWTISQIGHIYAEDPHWPSGVSYFYQRLQAI